MSRSTQLIGHTDKVSRFLQKCKKSDKLKPIKGMFGEDVYMLHKYIDKKGRVWKEFVQTAPWSSGPMIFLAIGCKATGKMKGWEARRPYGGDEVVDYQKGIFWV